MPARHREKTSIANIIADTGTILDFWIFGTKRVAASICVLSLEFVGIVYAHNDDRNTHTRSHPHVIGHPNRSRPARERKLNPDSSAKLPENRMASLSPNEKAREEREARRRRGRWRRGCEEGTRYGGFGNGMDAIREQERESLKFREG